MQNVPVLAAKANLLAEDCAHAFASAMAEMLPTPYPSAMAIAVSGGSDSVALSLLAHAWAQSHGITLTALTVDHGLRPESATEAAQVATWMAARGIAHETLHWRKPALLTGNLQASARAARYQLLTEWCRTHNVAHLLLGHHQEDQAETFLMNLARGSGIDGLAAMPPSLTRRGVTLLRPLLGLARDSLTAYLHHHQQGWVHDPSNDRREFTRVRIRQALPALADLGLDATTLSETAATLQRVREALERATDAALEDCVTCFKTGEARIDTAAWKRQPEEIGLRLLAALIAWMSGGEPKPRIHELQTIAELFREPQGAARTLHGCLFRRQNAVSISLEREFRAISPAEAWLPDAQTLIWDHRFVISSSKPVLSDTYHISCLGAEGLRQLDAAGVRWPSRTPRKTLHTLPAIWDAALENLLAVPHIPEWRHTQRTPVWRVTVEKPKVYRQF